MQTDSEIQLERKITVEFKMILLFYLLTEINAGRFNQYWGESIRHDLFQTDRSSIYYPGFNTGITFKYDPQVIPIGTDDFEQITNDTFTDLGSFVNEKCSSYVKHMRSEYGNQYYQNQAADHVPMSTMELRTHDEEFEDYNDYEYSQSGIGNDVSIHHAHHFVNEI